MPETDMTEEMPALGDLAEYARSQDEMFRQMGDQAALLGRLEKKIAKQSERIKDLKTEVEELSDVIRRRDYHNALMVRHVERLVRDVQFYQRFIGLEKIIEDANKAREVEREIEDTERRGREMLLSLNINSLNGNHKCEEGGKSACGKPNAAGERRDRSAGDSGRGAKNGLPRKSRPRRKGVRVPDLGEAPGAVVGKAGGGGGHPATGQNAT